LLATCATIYFSHYYPLLPKVVASHFHQHGIATGVNEAEIFRGFRGNDLAVGFSRIWDTNIVAIMARQLMTLPNKQYWLSPDQRAASMQFLSGWFA
jgi:hypothetical protein